MRKGTINITQSYCFVLANHSLFSPYKLPTLFMVDRVEEKEKAGKPPGAIESKKGFVERNAIHSERTFSRKQQNGLEHE